MFLALALVPSISRMQRQETVAAAADSPRDQVAYVGAEEVDGRSTSARTAFVVGAGVLCAADRVVSAYVAKRTCSILTVGATAPTTMAA